MGLLLFKKEKEYGNLPKHFKLLNKLGEGAFSVVFKAYNSEDNKEYAIKIISKLHLNRKQLKNISNEIQIMKNLNHKNVLKLYSYYNYADYCYLILEYCDGGEIFNKIIEYTYFSEMLSRFVFLQLLESIHYLHENDIVHRDIKPENLFFKQIPFIAKDPHELTALSRDSDDANKIDEGVFQPGIGGGGIGVIKLGDFGLAKKLTSSKTTNFKGNLKTPCGTAGYTAPEVICVNQDLDKENYYSKSVDIWSLGCFLYTILCGFPPFYDDDSHKLTKKILNGNYTFLKPWWDEISIEAKDLISKMLVIDPNNRITIEEIFNHPWCKNETFSDGYFNVNSKFENEHSKEVFNVVEDIETSLGIDLRTLKLKSPVGSYRNIQHIENIESVDNDSLDSDDPLSDQPSPFTQPPMVYGESESTIRFTNGMASPIPINSSINSNLINSHITTNPYSGSSFIPKSPVIQNGRGPILSPRANAIKSVFNNPAMIDMSNLSNLKFTHGSIFDINEDDSAELDSPPPYETINAGDSTISEFTPSKNLKSNSAQPLENSATKLWKSTVFKGFRNRNDHKLSLKSSNDSDLETEFDNLKKEIDTRQLSIVSSDKFDFSKLNEFQLNMNDLNIILRRKSTLTRKE